MLTTSWMLSDLRKEHAHQWQRMERIVWLHSNISYLIPSEWTPYLQIWLRTSISWQLTILTETSTMVTKRLFPMVLLVTLISHTIIFHFSDFSGDNFGQLSGNSCCYLSCSMHIGQCSRFTCHSTLNGEFTGDSASDYAQKNSLQDRIYIEF